MTAVSLNWSLKPGYPASMGRAENNDGSCREVASGRHAGKWRVQFTTQLPTGKKGRLSRLFSTKTEAREFLVALRHGAKVEAHRKTQALTLAMWFEWLAENDWPESLVPMTVKNRQGRFENHTRPHLGDVPLTELDPMTVRAFYSHLRSEGVGLSVLHEIRSDLVRVFNQAVSPYQRVPTTVANPFRLPLPGREPRRAVALTPEAAYRALTARSLTDSQRAMLAVFLLGGLRLGEQMALTKGQLRFDDDLIVVDRAVQIGEGWKQEVGLPKGRKTRCAVMCQLLKSAMEDVSAHLGPEDLLWPAATENKPRMKKLVYATWRTVVKDAGLPEYMSPHDCRLSHVNWIEKLMPDVSKTTLQEHVGHSAKGVTEANYTRPITTSQKVLRDNLDRLFETVKTAQSPKTAQAS